LRLLFIGVSIISLFDYIFDVTDSSASSVLVDTKKPGAYILAGEVACHQRNARSLVLHNNYRFPISVTLSGSASGNVIPSYEIVTDENGKSRVERFSEEVASTQPIRSGWQLSFCVVMRNISTSRYLRVPFEIVGDLATVEADKPEHFAVYYDKDSGSK
jgi:hypothetical protein